MDCDGFVIDIYMYIYIYIYIEEDQLSKGCQANEIPAFGREKGNSKIGGSVDWM